MARIDVKVATGISEHEIALNAGTNSGVQVGDIVTVFRNIEVKDPDTRELLGEVRVPVLNLKVNLVEARMSVAQVTDTRDSRDDDPWASSGYRTLVEVHVAEKSASKKEPETGADVLLRVGQEAAIDTSGGYADEPPF